MDSSQQLIFYTHWKTQKGTYFYLLNQYLKVWKNTFQMAEQ